LKSLASAKSSSDFNSHLYVLRRVSFWILHLSFIDLERGGFGEILPEVIIFPEGLCPEGNIITEGNISPNPPSWGSINDILYRKLKASKLRIKKLTHTFVNTMLYLWPEIQTICIPWTLARPLPVRGFLGFSPAHALAWKFRDIREEGLRISQSLSLFCRVVAMDYKRLHNTSSVDLLPDIYGKPNKRRRQKETSNIYEVEKFVAKRCVSGVSFWGFCMLIFCVV
jgi:hypothetical protein